MRAHTGELVGLDGDGGEHHHTAIPRVHEQRLGGASGGPHPHTSLSLPHDWLHAAHCGGAHRRPHCQVTCLSPPLHRSPCTTAQHSSPPLPPAMAEVSHMHTCTHAHALTVGCLSLATEGRCGVAGTRLPCTARCRRRWACAKHPCWTSCVACCRWVGVAMLCVRVRERERERERDGQRQLACALVRGMHVVSGLTC